jgi:3-hydroxybutyryl-CoA dehydratase
MISISDSARFTKTISEADVYMYAGLTGDLNPAHINNEYAKTTIFKERICHGMLLAGLISGVIGTKLPGPGTVYIEQSVKFLAPVYIGDTVTAIVEVARIVNSGKWAELITSCVNQKDTVVLEGRALVSLPRN